MTLTFTLSYRKDVGFAVDGESRFMSWSKESFDAVETLRRYVECKDLPQPDTFALFMSVAAHGFQALGDAYVVDDVHFAHLLDKFQFVAKIDYIAKEDT